MGTHLVKYEVDGETRLFIPHYSIVAHYSSLESGEVSECLIHSSFEELKPR